MSIAPGHTTSQPLTNFSKPMQPTEKTHVSQTSDQDHSSDLRTNKTRSFFGRTSQKRTAPAPEMQPQPHITDRPNIPSDPVLSKEERQEAAKAKARRYKQDQAERKAKERACKQIIGGVAWGFDPAAGLLTSGEKIRAEGWFVSGRGSRLPADTQFQSDHIGRLTGRRYTQSGTWGIEYGGPGREGKFDHGVLKGKMPAS
jgi:hypothetical protein